MSVYRVYFVVVVVVVGFLYIDFIGGEGEGEGHSPSTDFFFSAHLWTCPHLLGDLREP